MGYGGSLVILNGSIQTVLRICRGIHCRKGLFVGFRLSLLAYLDISSEGISISLAAIFDGRLDGTVAAECIAVASDRVTTYSGLYVIISIYQCGDIGIP